nr:hypothetical protein [Tanacetum cinerariifolium]GEY88139.1 hypothetical protein [Tanacetum cinerariifolium]
MDTCEKLMPNNGQTVSQLEYSRAINCLMYVMTCTRPDIAFAIAKLSRLTYTGYPSALEGYTDASWISNTEDNLSTSDWVFLLGGGAISWASKNEICITGSTIESEFVALEAAGNEDEWFKNLLLEIPLWSKPITHIFIRCNSVVSTVHLLATIPAKTPAIPSLPLQLRDTTILTYYNPSPKLPPWQSQAHPLDRRKRPKISRS